MDASGDFVCILNRSIWNLNSRTVNSLRVNNLRVCVAAAAVFIRVQLYAHQSQCEKAFNVTSLTEKRINSCYVYDRRIEFTFVLFSYTPYTVSYTVHLTIASWFNLLWNLLNVSHIVIFFLESQRKIVIEIKILTESKIPILQYL